LTELETQKLKKHWRQRLRQRLSALTVEERSLQSRAVCERIRGMDGFRQAETVLLYRPLPFEVDITAVWEEAAARGRAVYFPRVGGHGQSLLFLRAEPGTVWVRGGMDIWEPAAGEPLQAEALERAVVLVPGLGFSRTGERLGRGKGYYDRALSAPPIQGRGLRVGVAFREQLVEDLPVGPNDVLMQVVATPDGTWSTAGLSLFRTP
jgi:5-formyltetrahydrofolate cyclo-ligase